MTNNQNKDEKDTENIYKYIPKQIDFDNPNWKYDLIWFVIGLLFCYFLKFI
jgi:hypothetical protein